MDSMIISLNVYYNNNFIFNILYFIFTDFYINSYFYKHKIKNRNISILKYYSTLNFFLQFYYIKKKKRNEKKCFYLLK